MNPDDFLEAITAVGERALQLGDHDLICSLIAVGHTTRWFPAALYAELCVAEAAGKVRLAEAGKLRIAEAAGKDWDDNPPIETESVWARHGRSDLRVESGRVGNSRRFAVRNTNTNFGIYRWRWMAMRRMRAVARYQPAEDT
jgi:hypothetical protein